MGCGGGGVGGGGVGEGRGYPPRNFVNNYVSRKKERGKEGPGTKRIA